MGAKSMEEIADILRKMKFRHKTFGGVDEADVWRKLDSLQKEYRSAFEAQQIRNDALLKERDQIISRLRGSAELQQRIPEPSGPGISAGSGDAGG